MLWNKTGRFKIKRCALNKTVCTKAMKCDQKKKHIEHSHTVLKQCRLGNKKLCNAGPNDARHFSILCITNNSLHIM